MNGRKKLSAPDHLSQLRWFKIVSWQRWCLTVGLVGFLHLHLEMPRWSQESGTVPFVFGFIIHVKSSWWTFAVKRSIGLRVDHRKRRCTHTHSMCGFSGGWDSWDDELHDELVDSEKTWDGQDVSVGICCFFYIQSLVLLSSDTQVEDVFFMPLDDMDVEEKDRLWVSWHQDQMQVCLKIRAALLSFIHNWLPWSSL